MSAKQIVIAKLLGSAAVTNIVGNKIAPNKADQKWPAPYIVVSQPAEDNRQLLTEDAGFPRARVRIMCWATSPLAAATLRNAAFNALKNVTRETITAPGLSAIATIIPADFSADGYSDEREADAEIFDVYCDWRFT